MLLLLDEMSHNLTFSIINLKVNLPQVCEETLAAHKSRLGELKGLVAQIAKDVGLEAGGLLEAEVDALGKRLEDVRESLATLAKVAETRAASKDLCTDDLLQTKSFLSSVQQVGLHTSADECYIILYIHLCIEVALNLPRKSECTLLMEA